MRVDVGNSGSNGLIPAVRPVRVTHEKVNPFTAVGPAGALRLASLGQLPQQFFILGFLFLDILTFGNIRVKKIINTIAVIMSAINQPVSTFDIESVTLGQFMNPAALLIDITHESIER
jgi:hypothetical protein